MGCLKPSGGVTVQWLREVANEEAFFFFTLWLRGSSRSSLRDHGPFSSWEGGQWSSVWEERGEAGPRGCWSPPALATSGTGEKRKDAFVYSVVYFKCFSL